MRCRARVERSSSQRAIGFKGFGLSETYTSILSLLSRMSAPRLEALFAQDASCAAPWVYAAAADGLPQAQVCYGRLLLNGTGLAKDEVAAIKWFRRAASSGDIDAVNMVGCCLDNGWGTAENPTAAAEQYRRAADAGHAWAQYNLGHLYLDGRGVVRDFYRAYAYYLRAAEHIHERAMNLVGRCCEEGWGTPRDLQAAKQWYRRSAEGGYFRGQYNWATLLMKEGRFDEAAIWFERAATGGSAAVRQAVLDAIAVANPVGSLKALAARLQVKSG
jgi:uncharacterized protein